MIEIMRSKNNADIYLDVLSFAKKRYEDFGGSLQSVFSIQDVAKRFSLSNKDADFVVVSLVEMGFVEKLGSTTNYSITTDGIAALDDEKISKNVIIEFVRKKLQENIKTTKKEFQTSNSKKYTKSDKVIYKAFSDKDVREVMVLTIKVLLEEIEESSMFSPKEKNNWKELFKSLAKKQGFLWQVSNKLVEEFKNNKEKELLSS
jgi:hypothetical protein